MCNPALENSFIGKLQILIALQTVSECFQGGDRACVQFSVFSDLFLFFVHINLYSIPVMAERMWKAYLNYKS